MNSTCPYCGSAVGSSAERCPRCNSALVETLDDSSGERGMTRLEKRPVVPPTMQEKPVPPPPSLVGKSAAGGEGSKLGPVVQPYRPLHRPPMAVLGIFDDSGDSAEWVRIRGDKLTIGRSDGEVQIGHDTAISSRHLEVVRSEHKGRTLWKLRDLGSTNGTFVRAASAILRSGQEFLVGLQRFRAELNSADSSDAKTARDRGATLGWQKIAAQAAAGMRILEITPTGEELGAELQSGEYLLGADATCAIVVQNDPFVSPVHARIKRDSKSRWTIENAGAANGLWLRITEMVVESYCEFMAGEQRFVLRVPLYENASAR